VARRGMPNFLSSRRASPVVFGGTRDKLNSLRCCRDWRSQFGDESQDVGEQVSRDRDLRHPEGDIAAVSEEVHRDEEAVDSGLPVARIVAIEIQ
jgi:hypothetical protein